MSIDAAEMLFSESGLRARVVSFPCWELFDAQDENYRRSVLLPGVRKCVVEAGIKMGWEKYSGDGALYITVDEFGRSAPESALAEYFGFTPSSIAGKIRKFLS